jgi:hypothetical protein
VVETKTISKRGGPEEQVRWDGKQILVGGHMPDRDPAGQAAALARQLHQIIRNQTGESVFVQPTVVYPGWFVATKAPDAPVWVENAKQLLIRIKTAPGRLDATRIARVTTRWRDIRRPLPPLASDGAVCAAAGPRNR